MRLAPLVCGGATLLMFGASGCESTQEKSARLEAQAQAVEREKGLAIARQSRFVRPSEPAVLSDENGTAVALTLVNRRGTPLRDVPVAIDVLDRRNRTVFRNDAPGLERTLVSAPLVPGDGRVIWVNDQVLASGDAARVRVRTGDGRPAPRRVPRIEVGRPRLEADPVSGVAAVGRVTNRSRVLQRDLNIFAVAERRGRVVAAGKAQVKRLRPGRSATYSVFFIGNPRGARISVYAPPTVIEQGAAQ